MIEAAIYIIIAIVVFSIAKEVSGPKEISEPQERVAGVSVELISRKDEVTVPIKLSGQIKAKQSTTIRSLVQGTVQFLAPVRLSVFKGQQLFRLNNSSVETNYLTALSGVADAQARFSQTKLASGTALNQVELAVKQAEIALEQARQQLSDAKIQNELAQKQAEDTARVAYDSGYRVVESVIRFLGGPNLDKYIYEDVLSNDVKILGDIRNYFDASVIHFQNLSREPQTDLFVSLGELETVLTSVKNLTSSTWTFLRLAVPGGGYTEISLNTAVSRVGGFIDQLNAIDSQIKSSKNALNSVLEQSQVKISNIERTIELQELSLENTRNSLTAQSTNAELSQLGVSAQLNSANAQLAAASFQYENLALPAPFAGTVISHKTSVGTQVSPGQEIMEIGNLKLIEIRVEVSGSVSDAVVLGQEVLIDGNPVGRIAEIEAAADLATGKVGVKIEADNSQGQFVPGSIAEVEFELVYRLSRSILIPLKDVKVGQNSKKVLVFVDGEVTEREVGLGSIYGDLVEVTEGLGEGDLLIVSNGSFLKQGDKVEVRQSNN